MKKVFLITASLLVAFSLSFAQNNLGVNNTNPPASAALMVDTSAAGPQGMLIPRMTLSRRNAITGPATGLMVFQTDNTPGFYYFSGSAWTAAAGNPAVFELWVTKTAAEAQTTQVGSNLILPDILSFSNTSADQVNAPITGTSAPYNTPNGKWDGANGKFTAVYPGLYLVNLQIGGETNGVASVPMLDWNGTGNSGSSFYGTAYANTQTLQAPHRGRGSLERVLWMNTNDYFQVRLSSGSSAIGVTPPTDGSVYLKIVKLR